MGEIKSTLDLVMEKTKHLTMTEKEKNREKISEIKNRLRGLVQKYQDGFLNQNTFGKEIDRLDDAKVDVIELLKGELLDRIRMDAENREIMKLLKSFCGVRADNLVSIIEDYRQTLKAARREKIEENKKALSKKYSISGTAVLPNLDGNPEWEKRASEIRRKSRNRLEAEKEKLVG